MTTMRGHVETLSVDAWALLTKRVALFAVDAAARFNTTPPQALDAVVAMTEHRLVEHRRRHGPPQRRASAAMRVVEADRLRAMADGQARKAQQDKRDAELAAGLARDQAASAARETAQARQQARVARSSAAHSDQQRVAALADAEHALNEVRAELAGLRADSAAEIAAQQAKVRGAEVRVEQRIAERVSEREHAEQALEGVRDELVRVRADALAEVAAAREQARAAEARAEKRMMERADERRSARKAFEDLRIELEQVRSDSAAEVMAARERFTAELSAAHRAADDRVLQAQARAAAADRAAEEAIASARRTTAGVTVASSPGGSQVGPGDGELLPAMFVPIPPAGINAHTERIQDALANVGEVDYVLEAALTADDELPNPFDAGAITALLKTVHAQAGDLSHELRDLPSRCRTPAQTEAARAYAAAATSAYGNYLQRIAVAVQHLSRRGAPGDSAVVDMIDAMLSGHPWRTR